MFFDADAFYLPAAQVKRQTFLLQTVKSDLKEDLGNILCIILLLLREMYL